MGYYRHPKTANEMRQYFAALCDEDYPVRVRGRRRPHRLPHAWDDYYVHRERCWKRYRKTQYKQKK